jgi:hypothetical protein
VAAGQFRSNYEYNLDQDLVTLDTQNNQIWIYLSDGNGGYNLNGTPFPAGNTPKVVIAADVNDDTCLDLIVGDSDGNVATLLGHCDGSFSYPTMSRVPGVPMAMSTGYLQWSSNNPGPLCLTVGTIGATGNSITFLRNDGNGGWIKYDQWQNSSIQLVGLSVADLVDDIKPIWDRLPGDLVVLSNHSVQTYLNSRDGTGHLSLSWQIPITGDEAKQLLASGGDNATSIRGDEHVDLIIGTQLGMLVYMNNANGTFSSGGSYTNLCLDGAKASSLAWASGEVFAACGSENLVSVTQQNIDYGQRNVFLSDPSRYMLAGPDPSNMVPAFVAAQSLFNILVNTNAGVSLLRNQ